jgi:hypothetical protein
MDATLIAGRIISPRARRILRLLRLVGPAVLSAFVAWGAVQFAQGRNAERLDNAEKQTEETKHAVGLNLTREEFRSWTEENRENFRQVREDIRALRGSTK